MCAHEDRECRPGCRCDCMNCMFPPDPNEIVIVDPEPVTYDGRY